MAGKEMDIGMVGLGVMGRNLALNMADHGFAVAGFDKDASQVKALEEEADNRPIYAAQTVEEFVQALRTPRAVMMLVPAGPPVDAVIADVLPYLQKGDLIIDGGNSHFPDTDLRARELQPKGIAFLGVGISGGEWGARNGPSMMPGGERSAYARVQPIFEASAAQVNGEPCVAYLGPGSAGHYVKMVHNGIEYGLMQLIAESYDLMKRGLHLSDDELHEVYAGWNEQELSSYLLEITANIFLRQDQKAGSRLIDLIRGAAKQKGTGMWSAQDAMELETPTPTIDVAVAMRNLSALSEERAAVAQATAGPEARFQGERDDFVGQLRNALYAAMLLTYAQGLAQLRAASREYDYLLDLETVARIWRGGCIIRAAALEQIRAAYKAAPDLPNLLLDPKLGQEIASRQGDLRSVVRAAAALGLPAPAFAVSLAYFDGYRSAWLPANLIQAQRDYFGAHSYERIDQKGTFHTQWTRK